MTGAAFGILLPYVLPGRPPLSRVRVGLSLAQSVGRYWPSADRRRGRRLVPALHLSLATIGGNCGAARERLPPFFLFTGWHGFTTASPTPVGHSRKKKL